MSDDTADLRQTPRIGRRPDVSEAEVIDAGQRLLDAGKAVNGWSLRRALGDRGGPPRLQAIWDQHAPSAPAPPEADVELPAGIAEMAEQMEGALIAQMRGVLLNAYRHVENTTRARYHAEFEDFAQRRTQMDEEMLEATASIEATDAVRQKLQDQLEEAQKNLLAASGREAELKEQLASELGSKQQMETQLQERDRQIEVMGKVAQHAQESAAGANARAESAREEADRCRQQTEAAERERLKVVAEAAKAQGELEAERATSTNLRRELADLRAETARLAAEAATHAEELAARASVAEAKAATAEKVVQELRAAQTGEQLPRAKPREAASGKTKP